MVTLEQLMTAEYIGEIHFTGKHECTKEVGPRGGVTTHITRVRPSGMIKTWKRDPKRFHMPIKYGMRESWWIDEDNCEQFHLASECPLTGKES